MSFLDPFGGGGSTATQSPVAVSGQGQYNKGSTVLQGGAKGATGKAKYIETGASDLTGAKITGPDLKNSTLTYNSTGFSANDVTSLVAALTPTPQTQSESAPVVASPSAPAPLDNSTPTDTAASVISDSINKNPQVWLALAAVVLLFLFFRKKS